MPTEHQYSTETKLARIAWLSRNEPTKKFDGLMHHFNVESLTACYHELDGKKAVGADQVSKEDYGEALLEHLTDLVERMKRMAYRPGPVREVLIPKEGKPGATRPLGICSFEDKLVQKMTAKILESIYDPTFFECSYGFRRGRGCHDAIRALHGQLYREQVRTVIDIDLANYFGSIRPELIEKVLRMRIGDERFIRYIRRMLRAGVLRDGDLTVDEEGVPQGSPASPILANAVAHYVIDVWFEKTVRPRLRDRAEMFRYCDDLVITCKDAGEARLVLRELKARLETFGLKLNEEKTRLVSYSKKRAANGEKQGTFDFLGFTFFMGNSRNGIPIPKLQTSRKRLKSKLKRVTEWARNNRSRMKLRDLWPLFVAKINGHIGYYGVSFNSRLIKTFVAQATRIFHKWLNRRGGKRSLSWAKFQLFLKRNPLPGIRIRHKLFELGNSHR